MTLDRHSQQKKYLATCAGFTLVEMGIVIIIIGVLIGGIIKGQEIMVNSKISATITQIKIIDSASSTFIDMFDSYPGDMLTAQTRINNCSAAPCLNGNGNGRIDQAADAAAPVTAAAANEMQFFFGQLAAADLFPGLEGTFSAAWGKLYPESSAGGGFVVGYAASSGTFAGAYGALTPSRHYITLRRVPNNTPENSALSSSQAARLDRKMDDGVPSTGAVIASSLSASYGTGACGATATLYNEKEDPRACGLYIRSQH